MTNPCGPNIPQRSPGEAGHLADHNKLHCFYNAATTETLFFGNDIPLLSGWLADDINAPHATGAGPALTKKGEFVYASGRLVKPAGVGRGSTIAVIPVGWRPAATTYLPTVLQDGVDLSGRMTLLYVNERDPANPTAPGSDDTGYGIIYTQDLSGLTSQPSNANKGWLYLAVVWRAEV